MNVASLNLKKIPLSRWVITILMVVIGVSSYLTYQAFILHKGFFGTNPYRALMLLQLTLIFLLILAIFASRNTLLNWWKQLRHGQNTRLQRRIVWICSVVASVPTLMVAIFAGLFMHLGVQAWFNERVTTALEESVLVAEAYLSEHKEVIRADILSMANDLNRQAFLLMTNPLLFKQVVSGQANLRSLAEAVVFQNNTIIAQSDLSFSLAFEKIPLAAMALANKGEVVVMENEQEDKVRALIKLDNFFDTYLLVGRFVDNKVIEHMERTQGAVGEYKWLQAKIAKIQIQSISVFLLLAILLLIGAMWGGLAFAMTICQPLKEMVLITEQLKLGNLAARVQERHEEDELGILAKAFNQMAERLEQQRAELIEANRHIDERRQFTEMVLAGVSSGVIAVDTRYRVTLMNRAAQTLFNISFETWSGKPITQLLPEIASFMNQVTSGNGSIVQGEVTLTNYEQKLTLLVRIVAEIVQQTVVGYIITFDDITDLMVAQRRAAWSDVARRIAHEIKNPLTPVHLAAERLKRKYAKESSEPDTFIKYTDTIMRHVTDIRRMVEEFVAFARLPSPVLLEQDLKEVLARVVFSQECIGEEVHYQVEMPEEPIVILADDSQLAQAFGNIFKNAEEAMESQSEKRISLQVKRRDSDCVITIRDNGPGFPESSLDRLTEPYMTTRSKGTGLGLAIVKKIFEDHNAKLKLENHPDGGACVTVIFPLIGHVPGKNIGI